MYLLSVSSDPATALLDSLINRLPPSDRPRLRTYCYQLIAAATALGVARVIRACLPIRCDSSNRVLPTPGDAIPSNGLPPRPPPGKYRRRLPIPIPRSTRPSPTPTHCRLPITRANYELRANYERELTRELRGAPV